MTLHYDKSNGKTACGLSTDNVQATDQRVFATCRKCRKIALEEIKSEIKILEAKNKRGEL